MPESAYYVRSNQLEAGMTLKTRDIVLTKSQAACLIALRNGKGSKPEIALQAKLDLQKTATSLGILARLQLAKQGKRKGGIRPRVEKHAASRLFRIDCGKTAGLQAPADDDYSNC